MLNAGKYIGRHGSPPSRSWPFLPHTTVTNVNRNRLGVQVLRLRNRFDDGLDLAAVGQSVVAEVATACDETIHLALPNIVLYILINR
jgi:hypothetical protein